MISIPILIGPPVTESEKGSGRYTSVSENVSPLHAYNLLG